MSYTGDSYAASARSYSGKAGSAARRAARCARQAEDFYRRAQRDLATARRLAALRTYRPEIGYTPAAFEASARSWIRSADTSLSLSFGAAGTAAWLLGQAAAHRSLAAAYRDLAEQAR